MFLVPKPNPSKKVIQVKKKDDGKIYAMKSLRKEQIIKRKQVDHTRAEKNILQKIQHPFIVQLHYAFQTEDKLYMILEYVYGGELFFHLKSRFLFFLNFLFPFLLSIISCSCFPFSFSFFLSFFFPLSSLSLPFYSSSSISLPSSGRFTAARSKFYAASLTLVLAHLHSFDIVYRDLKPENILIDQDGSLLLLLFFLPFFFFFFFSCPTTSLF